MSKKPRISYRELQAPDKPAAPATPAAPPSPVAPVATARATQPIRRVVTDAPSEIEQPVAQPPKPITPPQAASVPEASAPQASAPQAPAVQASAPQAPAAVQPKLTFRERARLRDGSADLLLFRVGPELFGLPLSAVEEAIDCPPAHPLPEMPRAMRGVFLLRESMVSLFASDALLGVEAQAADTALVFRGRGRRVALAVDDVDDVFTANLATLRDVPGSDAADGILLGVVRRGADLIGVLDPDALLVACRSESALEAAA